MDINRGTPGRAEIFFYINNLSHASSGPLPTLARPFLIHESSAMRYTIVRDLHIDDYEYCELSAMDLCLLTLAWLGASSFWVVLLSWLVKAVF